MITIYTHSRNPLHTEFWKHLVRTMARKSSGPDAVRDSLIRGLTELDIPFRLNDHPRPGDTVLVLSGIEALKNAIYLRRTGRISKLIVGPNVAVHPNDAAAICDTAVDILLVPSGWVADFWTREAPELASKLHTWASGTAIAPASSRTGPPIIYDKLGNVGLLRQVQDEIGSHHLFTYGTFRRADYLAALADAPYLVYLARSESQGMALQEAWARNVPTFVNKSTHWVHERYSFDAAQINCPYLTPALGAVFDKPEELHMVTGQYTTLDPKQHHDIHLSDTASVHALLQLI